MARTTDGTAISWPAVSTAVGLLTRQQTCPEVSRETLLDGHAADDVLEAMTVIAGAFAAALSPGDKGARVLQHLGLRVLELEAER